MVIGNDNWRLKLHIMPPKGWLNDPNGLCFFKGEYHVFFQYSPEDVNGGLKHWGHYKSRDLVKWEFVGIPISPEEAYEKDGVYSGCAFVENDKIHLFYTGNVKMEGNYDYITEGRESNVIHAICKDGITVTDKQCIMTNSDYPANYTCHVRDPKVWKTNGIYYMILGGRDIDDVGKVLVYCSYDLKKWTFCNEVYPEKAFGYMWECPDYFEVNHNKILSVSPQGVSENAYSYQNIYQSGYYFLDGNIADAYKLSEFKEWDMGFDFYAPQTFEDEKGRRILIAWMGVPDAPYTNPTTRYGWQHALTMPRVVSVKDGMVLQQPVEELRLLLGKPLLFKSGEKIELEANISEVVIDNSKEADCIITIANGLQLRYDSQEHIFTMEFLNEIGCGRKKRMTKISRCWKIQIFIDTSAVEVYLNDGEIVMTTRYYPGT
ncbi:MAG: glycoside hydrolase family 32 protein [Lachnospiraceae bacterium]|nr:glycoside hydrolase family 32 protein [Lachnospiraceae bacterium]